MIMRRQRRRQQLLLPLACLVVLPVVCNSFSIVSVGPSATAKRQPQQHVAAVVTTSRTTSTTSTALYGLFDGVKDAFSAPTLERSQIDAERETPIDRWMGWSVASENKKGQQQAMKNAIDTTNFVDAMDAKNYVTVHLSKPMGIVFEENDADYGGIFVHSIKTDGQAAVNGQVQVGDQLVAVQATKVSGLPFDDALSAIIDADESSDVKLIFFRGKPDQFYGPTGASQDWLNEFVGNGGGATGSARQPPVAKGLEVVVQDGTSSSSSG